jgi:hypothetical protein
VVYGISSSDQVLDVDDVLGLPAPRHVVPAPVERPPPPPSTSSRRKVEVLDVNEALAAPVVEPDHSQVSRPKSGIPKGPALDTLAASGTTSFELELSELPTCWACVWVHRPDRGGLLALKFLNMNCAVHGWDTEFRTVAWVRVNGSWAVGRCS